MSPRPSCDSASPSHPLRVVSFSLCRAWKPDNGCEIRNTCSAWTTRNPIPTLPPILPDFLLNEEADGELIVYTRLKETAEGCWKRFQSHTVGIQERRRD